MFKRILVAGAALCTMVSPAFANPAGSWAFSVGAHNVDPQGGESTLNDGTVIEVGSNIRPTVTAEYFISDNLGIELLASWPFEHDVSVPGVGDVASTKHLPPTLTLQYHLGDDADSIRPFVGGGVNYTLFFDEDTTGILTGVDVNLDDTIGLAAHAGVDVRVSDDTYFRADVRWIGIEPDISINGADAGSVDINPLVYGISLVRNF